MSVDKAVDKVPDKPHDTNASELDVEQLERVLDQMDPGLSKGLEEVKNVASSADVQIEATVEGEFASDENPTAQQPRLWKRWLNQRWQAFKARVRQAKVQLIVFAQTAPKEFAKYALSRIKQLFKFLGSYAKALAALSRMQKLSILIVGALLAVTGWIVMANIKGTWLPSINDPILTSLGEHADKTFEYSSKKNMISFFRAFPQDPEMFLMNKFKVNLKRSSDHPNPMGAFELYVQLDSRDTAIEMQTREVELHDMVQRIFEDETYNDVVSDLGKARLKGLIKKEISRVLTQGWATDVHFKMFVLKP